MLQIKATLLGERDWFIILLFIIYLVTRIPALLSPQCFIAADEAVEGIMAKHILRGERPIFQYGASYGGGLAIISYIAALFFKLFGVNYLIIKVVPLMFSLAAIVLLYIFLRKHFNQKIAYLTSILLTISPPFFTMWNCKIQSYVTAMFFNILVMFIFYEIFFKSDDVKNILLFGLVSGIGYYNHQSMLVTLLACFMVLFTKNKKFFLDKRWLGYIVFFVLGASPLIYFNLKNDLATFKTVYVFTKSLEKIILESKRLVSYYLPVIMGDTIDYGLREGGFNYGYVSPLSWIYYSVFIFSFCVIFWVRRKSMLNIFSLGLFKYKIAEIGKEDFLLVFLILYTLAYCINKFYVTDFIALRYIYLYYPFIPIVISLTLNRMAQASRYMLPILLTLLIISLKGNITTFKIYKENPVEEIISFLDSKNIKYVYTDYFLKWPLIFESNEGILASCDGIATCSYRYTAYEEEVDKHNATYIFIRYSSLHKKLEDYLKKNNISYEIELIDYPDYNSPRDYEPAHTHYVDRVIYYNLSEVVKPREVRLSGPWSGFFE